MTDEARILGLFYSDQDNIIYDKVKFSESLSNERKNELSMLSFKFLGPVFLTAASGSEEDWKIEFIESSLSLRRGVTLDVDIIQSFFSLNSSIKSEDGITNLFALIGSEYTEDINEIYNILAKYIHPSICQGKIANEGLVGSRFNFHKFIKNELERGIKFLDYSLGSSRKVPWEKQQKYTCVGLIERLISEGSKTSNLYTFDKSDPLRKEALMLIPSFYVMSILPDYYENLIDETLNLFNKTSVYSNIRLIHLRCLDKRIVYLEEFVVENDIKKSYGAILVQDNKNIETSNNIFHYKKNLRLILDSPKELNDIINKINPRFKYIKWATKSNEDLDNIKMHLDSINN